MKCKWLLGILLLWPIATTLQRSTSESLSYVGAVAEYSPFTSSFHGKKYLEENGENIENYVTFIKTASQYAVDILVFPESTSLYFLSYIPDPKDEVIPCLDTEEKYANSLKEISCAARKYSMYVVVNHGEMSNCTTEQLVLPATSCTSNGDTRILYYSTNVAFDRTGKVVARYRQSDHSLRSEVWGITRALESATFHTDFGVTFGQLISADLMFEKPALSLVRDLGVTDFLYSVQWTPELPYLFDVQAQAGWAYANDVNMLAAGSKDSFYDFNGGSGIYLGRNGYVHVTSEAMRQSNILIVSEIPKVMKGEHCANRLLNSRDFTVHGFWNGDMFMNGELIGPEKHLHKIDNLELYTTDPIDLKAGVFKKTVCDRGMCCDFDLKYNFSQDSITNEINYYRYRVAAFNGVSYTKITGYPSVGLKVCGLISCLNDDPKSCGHLFHLQTKLVPTTFEFIDISVTSVGTNEFFFMPVSLTEEIVPLNAADFFFEQFDRHEGASYKMGLKKARNDLITFSIYGRHFTRDFKEVSGVTSGVYDDVSPPIFIVVALACILTYLRCI